ncbi:MAG: hypothetical protein ACFFCX_18010 [Candidatus Sifarchaeia archaeon]
MNAMEKSRYPVNVYFSTGDVERGMLAYGEEGPIVVLDKDVSIVSNQDTLFSFVRKESDFPLHPNEKMKLTPVIISEMGYSEHQSSETMYPPCSGNWISYIRDSDIQAFYVVHTIVDSKKLLLSIISKSHYRLLHSFLINPYEIEILFHQRDWMVNNDIVASDKHSDKLELDSLLKDDPPSWPFLARITEGADVPHLKIAKNLRDTLDQLIPTSYPENEREQVLAFFAWLQNARIPRDDPVDFMKKYATTWVFRTLVNGHLRCMLDDVNPPLYLQIIQQVENQKLSLPKTPSFESTDQESWFVVWRKLTELFPDWRGRVVDMAISMNKSGQIHTKLPVSRAEARKSKKAWADRFAMVTQGLLMRGHIQKERIGLKCIVYVGGAHTWPHKHLEWSARLGFSFEKPIQIQVMVMPPSGFQRLRRFEDTLHTIEWEQSVVNLERYNREKKKWNFKTSLVAKSLESNRSLRQLQNEFGGKPGGLTVPISQQQAKILDLVSWGMYLSAIESGLYNDYFGVTNKEILGEIKELLQKEVFSLSYTSFFRELTSFLIHAKGPIRKMCSLTRSFLKYAPSATTMVSETSNECFILSRIPNDVVNELTQDLQTSANEFNVNLRLWPISAYTGYRNNLYRRLLMDDGLWDDDLSGLTRQARQLTENQY